MNRANQSYFFGFDRNDILRVGKHRLTIATLPTVTVIDCTIGVSIEQLQLFRLAFGINLVAVGLVLRLEHEVFVCRSKEHFTVKVLAKSFTTVSKISLTYLILIQSL
jgi:hypothetical protein